MGLILCRKHGEAGVVDGVSIDICRDFWEKKSEIKEIFLVVSNIYDDDVLVFSKKYYVSKGLFFVNNMEISYDVRDEIDENRFMQGLPEVSGLCMFCFEDYIKDNKISILKNYER